MLKYPRSTRRDQDVPDCMKAILAFISPLFGQLTVPLLSLYNTVSALSFTANSKLYYITIIKQYLPRYLLVDTIPILLHCQILFQNFHSATPIVFAGPVSRPLRAHSSIISKSIALSPLWSCSQQSVCLQTCQL